MNAVYFIFFFKYHFYEPDNTRENPLFSGCQPIPVKGYFLNEVLLDQKECKGSSIIVFLFKGITVKQATG